MSEIQDQINRILSNPDALKQVQSLGEQLGLTKSAPQPSQSPPPANNVLGNEDMLKAFTSLAPIMQNFNKDDETTRLLEALRPFLSEEKRQKLDRAEKMVKFIRLIPLLKDNGLFF